MEKVDFLTKKIETITPIPFDQARSRASKKRRYCCCDRLLSPMLRNVNLKVLKMAHFPIQMRSLAFEDQ